jgi:hypothetical protein
MYKRENFTNGSPFSVAIGNERPMMTCGGVVQFVSRKEILAKSSTLCQISYK